MVLMRGKAIPGRTDDPRAHIAQWGHDPATFCGDKPEFYDVYSVDHAKAKGMAAMLAKCAKQRAKDQAYENGDIFLAFARAIGAEWVVYPRRGKQTGNAWRDTTWVWYGLADGRNLYRSVIAEALKEADAGRVTSGEATA